MKYTILICASLLCTGTLQAASMEIPDKVEKLLKAIPTIKKTDRRDVVFRRLGLWDDEEKKFLTGSSSLGESDEIWDLLGDGHWILVVVSETGPNESVERAQGGTVARFQIYWRKKVIKARDPGTKTLFWEDMVPLLPYVYVGKVHLPPPTGTEQGADVNRPQATQSQDKH